MKTLLAFFLIPTVLLGCEDNSPSPPTTGTHGWYLRTMDHDAHRFIVASTGRTDGGISVIHHPDCERLSKK